MFICVKSFRNKNSPIEKVIAIGNYWYIHKLTILYSYISRLLIQITTITTLLKFRLLFSYVAALDKIENCSIIIQAQGMCHHGNTTYIQFRYPQVASCGTSIFNYSSYILLEIDLAKVYYATVKDQSHHMVYINWQRNISTFSVVVFSIHNYKLWSFVKHCRPIYKAHASQLKSTLCVKKFIIIV